MHLQESLTPISHYVFFIEDIFSVFVRGEDIKDLLKNLKAAGLLGWKVIVKLVMLGFW